MSRIVMRGTREAVLGLLDLMREEIGSGLMSSDIAFSEHPGCDPSVTFVVEVADDQRYDTTMPVRAHREGEG